MKNIAPRRFFLALGAIVILLAKSDNLHASDVDFTTTKPIRIVLIGDSTMTDHAGWGLGFKQFLTDRIECINTSAGGRSSMSFMKEGRWTNALALKGDYYLIQFGHNNEPGKPGRSTDMPTFIHDMEQYVDDARAIGAKPVLITPLTRRQWDKNNPRVIKSSLEPYAVEVRKIAASKKVPLLELHQLSKDLCESLGPVECLEFSPSKTVDGKVVSDGTHLKPNGSVMFARIIVDELKKKTPELATFFREMPLSENPVAKESVYDAVVSADGSGTFTNLQDAINADVDGRSNTFSILVKPGTYQGQFMVPKGKNHIRLIGEEKENTILTYARNVNEPETGVKDIHFSGIGVIVLADDFRAQNIKFENISGDHGQALALRVDGDRAIIKNCILTGWQDTLRVENGRHYFTNCHIEGRVDFIYGSATAVFDHCEILSKNGGHVTAANTPKDRRYGLVFMNCNLVGDPEPWKNAEGIPANTNSPPTADLGRPWRPYASVTYLNCELGAHIKPEGWNNWRNPTNELTARFAEYSSTGPGANPNSRFKWTRQLTATEAAEYTIKNIFHREDDWDPTVP